MSASYLYLLLDIGSEDRLRTKLYNKGDNFNFPMVNIPFICNKIPSYIVDTIFQSLCFLLPFS